MDLWHHPICWTATSFERLKQTAVELRKSVQKQVIRPSISRAAFFDQTQANLLCQEICQSYLGSKSTGYPTTLTKLKQTSSTFSKSPSNGTGGPNTLMSIHSASVQAKSDRLSTWLSTWSHQLHRIYPARIKIGTRRPVSQSNSTDRKHSSRHHVIHITDSNY